MKITFFLAILGSVLFSPLSTSFGGNGERAAHTIIREGKESAATLNTASSDAPVNAIAAAEDVLDLPENGVVPMMNATEPPASEGPGTVNTVSEAAPSSFPVTFFPSASLEVPGSALTLRECYVLALKQSETIAINAELIREAEAHFLQSLGSLLPQVSYLWSQTNQDSEKAFSSFSNNKTRESKFVFKQTLFSGFKEFAGMSGSKLEQKQRAWEKQRAEHLLFVDVADAFYLLLEQQEDLRTLEGLRQALNDRIVELKKREDIGRSRHSEVVNTETQLFNIEAEIELVKSRQTISRELLSFLTGQDIEQVADPQDTPDSLPEEVNYSAQGDSRPDVQAAQYAWGVAKKQIIVTRSDLFPTVSLEGNYFQHRDTEPEDGTWSTVFKVDVPIFEGTSVYGAVKVANAQARVRELEFLRAKRLAASDIHDSFVRAEAAISRTKVLDKALKSAELNYSLQNQDYRYSLVNNLEVLAAIQNLGNTRRDYIRSLYEKKRRFWELQAAAGRVEMEQMP